MDDRSTASELLSSASESRLAPPRLLKKLAAATQAVELSPRHSASARPAFRRQEGFGGKKGKDDKSKNAASRKAKEKVEQKRRKIAERPQHPLDIPRVCYRAPGAKLKEPARPCPHTGDQVSLTEG